MSLKILIVDDSAVIRHSLRHYIEGAAGWQVCGEAENGKIAVERVAELKPDLVILDLSMPVMNGLDAARQITRIAPKIAIVMFTMHSSEQLYKEAQSAGIRKVISKSEGIETCLFPVLRDLVEGHRSSLA